jgi:hypothetical protein
VISTGVGAARREPFSDTTSMNDRIVASDDCERGLGSATTAGIGLDADARRKLYRDMLRIRRVEERIVDLYPEQEMRCPVHLSIGQEAAAVGTCAPLAKTDSVFSGHRAHAHYLANGGDLKAMLAEMYGSDLPPLTGSKCLVRDAGQLVPWKKGVNRYPGSDFRSNRSSITYGKQRSFWPAAKRSARSVATSGYRSRVTTGGGESTAA